jgi:hypothetical protein
MAALARSSRQCLKKDIVSTMWTVGSVIAITP